MAVKDNWQTGEQFTADDANAVASAVNAAEVAANKDQPNGYAGLDSNGLLVQSQLPNEFVSPTIIGGGGQEPLTIKIADGTTVFTFTQYGELVSQVGYGVHYDGNVSNTAFSAWGPLYITSGKGSGDPHDITIAPSGSGAINLDADSVLVNGVEAATADDVAAKEDSANKGVAGGYASLDENALVPQEQLPITTADWDTLEGKPAVVAAGATEADARAAISAEFSGNKGQPNGFASLDASGYVPLSQWGAQVVDGGGADAAPIETINGGSA